MRVRGILVLVAALVVGAPSAWAQEQAPAQLRPEPATIEQVIDRVIQREAEVAKIIRQYSPLVEIYIQDLRPDKDLVLAPQRDHYFLGKADLDSGVVFRSLVANKRSKARSILSVLTSWTKMFSWGSEYYPEGFLSKVFVDRGGLDRQNYEFRYVRREFLGEVRCLVFDLAPKTLEGRRRFKGRIWVEDHEYTIVRFSGARVPQKKGMSYSFHFDSWRLHAGPGQWLPAYVYSAESDMKDLLWKRIRFKSQVRLWGYNLQNSARQDEFSTIKVETAAPLRDRSEAESDPSPLEATRLWERQAEDNVLERLELGGLLAPAGEVEKVLRTVVNNLEVTNNLTIEPEVRCRVLLTSRLESLTVGRTIVISRGLLDVLPDEASLAAILAHELAHITLGSSVDPNWGFYDRVASAVQGDPLRDLSFHSDEHKELAANHKALELMKNSPYKDKLGSVGLFFRALDNRAKQLPSLMRANLGAPLTVTPEMLAGSPEYQVTKLDQIAALPLGTRIRLDPWSSRLELTKQRPLSLVSAREKQEFEVTPFMPYLSRQKPADATLAVSSPEPPRPPQKDPQ